MFWWTAPHLFNKFRAAENGVLIGSCLQPYLLALPVTLIRIIKYYIFLPIVIISFCLLWGAQLKYVTTNAKYKLKAADLRKTLWGSVCTSPELPHTASFSLIHLMRHCLKKLLADAPLTFFFFLFLLHFFFKSDLSFKSWDLTINNVFNWRHFIHMYQLMPTALAALWPAWECSCSARSASIEQSFPFTRFTLLGHVN